MKSLKSFKKSPLISCVVEIRFRHSAGDMIPGMVYSAVSRRYKSDSPETLPALEMPKIMREQDPGLIFQPTHRIKAKGYSLNVGPRVLLLSYTIGQDGDRYPGWDVYFSELKDLNKELGDIGLFKNIERIGIRYINFFEEDKFLDKITLGINTDWSSQLTDELNIGVVVRDGEFRTKVIVNTKSKVQFNTISSRETKAGHILDLDTYLDRQIKFTELMKKIDEGHTIAKKVFEESLKKDFRDSLGPQYA